MSEREYIYKELASAIIKLSQDAKVYMLDTRQLLIAISTILLQLANKKEGN